jgi:hypothetical protein
MAVGRVLRRTGVFDQRMALINALMWFVFIGTTGIAAAFIVSVWVAIVCAKRWP